MGSKRKHLNVGPISIAISGQSIADRWSSLVKLKAGLDPLSLHNDSGSSPKLCELDLKV